MRSLVLDTATSYGVVGLFEDGKLIAKEEFQAAFTNSQLLLPAIDKLHPDQLEYIVVGIGPGSYTGIRVAVAFAKGLSFAKNIPLVGVSSLRGFVSEHEGSFIGAIDAKIGGIYAIKGIHKEGIYTFDSEEELLSVPKFAEKLLTVDFLVTPDAEPLRNRIPDLQAHIVERKPSIELLASLGYEAFKAGKGVYDGNLPLLYLRKTQAELERE
jgi:tRNA threonylcarbamoyladenosine biosynthesis protein TsaB